MTARRRLRATELGACISARKHSEVFRVGADRVLKLFRGHVRVDLVERELRTAMRVHAAGIPTPAVDAAIFETDGGRHGLMFEYIEATPLSKLFERHPLHIARYARLFADLHRRVHEFEAVDGLPMQRIELRDRILQSGRMSLGIRQQLLARLDACSESQAPRLCHGNFHPSNVLVHGDRAWVLSLGNACNGDPIADVARTSTILAYADIKSSGLAGWLSTHYSRWRNRLYLARYLDGERKLQLQFDTWLVIQMARRLEDGIAKAESEALEKNILRRLSAGSQSSPSGAA